MIFSPSLNNSSSSLPPPLLHLSPPTPPPPLFPLPSFSSCSFSCLCLFFLFLFSSPSPGNSLCSAAQVWQWGVCRSWTPRTLWLLWWVASGQWSLLLMSIWSVEKQRVCYVFWYPPREFLAGFVIKQFGLKMQIFLEKRKDLQYAVNQFKNVDYSYDFCLNNWSGNLSPQLWSTYIFLLISDITYRCFMQ